MSDGRQNRKTAISPQWFKRLTWAAAVSRGIPRICRGDPRHLANGVAEFGKICRGKLRALVTIAIFLCGSQTERSLLAVYILLMWCMVDSIAAVIV